MNKNGSRWLPSWKRLAIYLRDSFQCQYCQRDLRNADRSEITLDHIICRIAGGSHEANNLITACRTCNSSRRALSFTDFAKPEAQSRVVIQLATALNSKLAKSILKAA